MKWLVNVRTYNYAELMMAWPGVDAMKSRQRLPNGHLLIRTQYLRWLECYAETSLKAVFAFCMAFPAYCWAKLTKPFD